MIVLAYDWEDHIVVGKIFKNNSYISAFIVPNDENMSDGTFSPEQIKEIEKIKQIEDDKFF